MRLRVSPLCVLGAMRWTLLPTWHCHRERALRAREGRRGSRRRRGSPHAVEVAWQREEGTHAVEGAWQYLRRRCGGAADVERAARGHSHGASVLDDHLWNVM